MPGWRRIYPSGLSVAGQGRLPATAGGWVAVELDVRLYLRDEITTQLMVALRVRHEYGVEEDSYSR